MSAICHLPAICSSTWPWLQQDLCADHRHDTLLLPGYWAWKIGYGSPWIWGKNWLVSYASSLKPIHGTYLNIIFDDKIPIFESSFSIILHECWCRRKKVKQFLSMSQPVLFIGESGTAKSVACLHRHFCGFVQKWRPLKSNSLLFLCYPY